MIVQVLFMFLYQGSRLVPIANNLHQCMIVKIGHALLWSYKVVALHICKKNIPISCGINLTNIISCPRRLLTHNYNTKIRNKRYEILVLELFFSSIWKSRYSKAKMHIMLSIALQITNYFR